MCLIRSFFCTKVTTTAIAYSHKDWMETPEEHVIKVDQLELGLRIIAVTVEREERVLQIIVGKRNHSRHHRMERSSSGRSFLRRYMLPENAIVDQVKMLWENENGVLTVTFPKEEIKKPVLITGLDN